MASPTVVTWPASTLSAFLERSRTTEDRYFAAWHPLAGTGVRRGEALGVWWSDIDLDAGRKSITQTVIATKHVVSSGTPETRQGRRQIALDDGTVAVLRDLRRQQVAERLRMGDGWTDTQPSRSRCRRTGT